MSAVQFRRRPAAIRLRQDLANRACFQAAFCGSEPNHKDIPMKSNPAVRTAMRALWLMCLLIPVTVPAQQKIEVTNAWARATVPGQKVGGVYMEIRSATPARLLSVSSSAAGRAELHNMKIENGVMKMFPVDGVDLPAGQSVKLAPGGNHVMLIDLKQELKQGENIAVTLTVEASDKTRQTIEVKAEIRDITGLHK
jgi:copper(I)-binding protein